MGEPNKCPKCGAELGYGYDLSLEASYWRCGGCNKVFWSDEEIELHHQLAAVKLQLEAATNIVDTYEPQVSKDALLHDKVFWLGQQYDNLRRQVRNRSINNSEMFMDPYDDR